VIFREHTYATEAHVLIAGIARTTCLNADKERVTAGFIAPGLIPELPSLSTSRFDFCWEAYNNCRVGTLDWNGFGGVTLNGREAAFTRFHHSSVKYWYRLFRRTSPFLDRITLSWKELRIRRRRSIRSPHRRVFSAVRLACGSHCLSVGMYLVGNGGFEVSQLKTSIRRHHFYGAPVGRITCVSAENFADLCVALSVRQSGFDFRTMELLSA
jgi:hypothetical protein